MKTPLQTIRLCATACGLLLALASPISSAAVSVGVATVLEEELANEVTLIGSAVPRRTTQVSAQVDGMVTTIRVDRGSQVSQGAELFHLDDAIARFDLQRAEAQLAQADAEVDEARRKLTEVQRLRTDGHIPQTTVDTAATTLAIAMARQDERKAEVGRAQKLLEQHSVKAPFNGTVVAKSAELGQWIRRDASVVQLVETDPARIEVPVPEQHYVQLAPDTTATVHFDSLPDQSFEATVGGLVPQGLEGARTFPVWLEIPNQDGQIAPGMSARVTLVVDQSPVATLSVPSDALVRRADGSTLLWLVKEDAAADSEYVAKAVRVQVGDAIGQRIQVEGDGLRVGDLVVIRGNESLRPNQRVKIVTGSAGGE